MFLSQLVATVSVPLRTDSVFNARILVFVFSALKMSRSSLRIIVLTSSLNSYRFPLVSYLLD